MTKRITVINQMRPRIISQGVVNTEAIANRMAKNTTYNEDELFGMLRMAIKEINSALQNGETVKLDGLLNITAAMQVGGRVKMKLRGDRTALAALNNPTLWTGKKVSNYAHINKDADTMVTEWNINNPDNQVID